jgi:uncharacterized membrane protein
MNYIHHYWLTSHTISGTIHFITAIIGLILGLGILFLKPGSKKHKIAGYIFIPVLICVNLSVITVNQMGSIFGSIGPFHLIIPFSLYALYKGMRPFMSSAPSKTKIQDHVKGMVAAALGLWAAFVAEFIVRTPILTKILFLIPINHFWLLTIEGFSIVFVFMFLIKRVSKYQLKRMNLLVVID